MKVLFIFALLLVTMSGIGFLQAQTMEQVVVQLGVQEDGYFRQVDFEALVKSSKFGGLQ